MYRVPLSGFEFSLPGTIIKGIITLTRKVELPYAQQVELPDLVEKGFPERNDLGI